MQLIHHIARLMARNSVRVTEVATVKCCSLIRRGVNESGMCGKSLAIQGLN